MCTLPPPSPHAHLSNLALRLSIDTTRGRRWVPLAHASYSAVCGLLVGRYMLLSRCASVYWPSVSRPGAGAHSSAKPLPFLPPPGARALPPAELLHFAGAPSGAGAQSLHASPFSGCMTRRRTLLLRSPRARSQAHAFALSLFKNSAVSPSARITPCSRFVTAPYSSVLDDLFPCGGE